MPTRLLTFVLAFSFAVAAAEPLPPPQPTAHTTQQLEGWTVQVDNRLLAGPDAELGQRALRLLANALYDIKLFMVTDRVERLQRVPLWLDRTHGKLTSMQYHPNPQWLADHGYSTNLAKCVHIPDAARFANAHHQHQQPWAVLHELAHAYHDQVLGFDDPEIKAVWQRVVASGHFDSVLHIDHRMQKHYALTDQKEFFAEMSESYFGMNDFYPFNRAELKQAEPEVFALLEKIWGPTP